MDEKRYLDLQKETVEAGFKGKRQIVAKNGFYCDKSSEREMARTMALFFDPVAEAVKELVPQILKEYELETEARGDGLGDFLRKMGDKIKKVFSRFGKKWKGRAKKQVTRVGEIAVKRSTEDWRRMVRASLRVNILDDYYSGDYFAEILDKWIEENVSYIQGLPDWEAERLAKIIRDAYLDGMRTETLQKRLQEEVGMTKTRAKLIARDQMTTLISQVNEKRQRDAGITCYEWSSSRDQRVRDCHRALDGKRFSWSDPPAMWYRTEKGIVYTGRRCHPGEDYCCRCVALPVFDIDTLNLPVE